MNDHLHEYYPAFLEPCHHWYQAAISYRDQPQQNPESKIPGKNGQNLRPEMINVQISGSGGNHYGHDHQCGRMGGHCWHCKNNDAMMAKVAEQQQLNSCQIYLCVLKILPPLEFWVFVCKWIKDIQFPTTKYSRDRSCWFCNLWENLRAFHAPIMAASRKSNKDV